MKYIHSIHKAFKSVPISKINAEKVASGGFHQEITWLSNPINCSLHFLLNIVREF
jgi:hypothetical protein